MKRTEVNIILHNNESNNDSMPARFGTNMNHSHIPVPKILNNTKSHDRFPPVRRQSIEKNAGKAMSVAAQTAVFEKLDATANPHKPRQNVSSPFIENHRNGENKFPLPKKSEHVPVLNRRDSFSEGKWKSKFDESEKRRKMALLRSDTVNKEIADLDKKYQFVFNENKKLHLSLNEREQELHKLKTVSEAVCKEYEQLKLKYDIETGAMHRAMQQASEWYKQNRQLKRQSQVIAQKVLLQNPDLLPDLDLTDDVHSNDDDAEQLRETIRELSEEVAKLQTELNTARLEEFETQEQVTLLTTQLEEERAARKLDNEKLKELLSFKENATKISEDNQAQKVKENARITKLEADRLQKMKNVVTHSVVNLTAKLHEDPTGTLTSLLQDIENLKKILEEEQQNHAAEIQLLQDQLEEKESNVEFEIVEEKLKLAESELEMVVERAERAEREAKELRIKIAELEDNCQGSKSFSSAAMPPPPPPPPPPPMPFLPMLNNTQSSIKLIAREKGSGLRNSAVADMEKMLGINKKPCSISPQPAIDDIISQIKGGKFTLKHTDKQREEERKRKEVTENPALSEMLDILGTMRRKAKPSRKAINLKNDPVS